MTAPEHDPVNHPTHYASDATCGSCGAPIECIDVVRHQPFNLGNSIKYLWRAGKKDDVVQDLKKAIWYIEDQIAMIQGAKNPKVHSLSRPGPKIINHPECKFDSGVEMSGGRGWEFKCKTHNYSMFMPIDKAPQHCTMYETETE